MKWVLIIAGLVVLIVVVRVLKIFETPKEGGKKGIYCMNCRCRVPAGAPACPSCKCRSFVRK